jgi:multicomponent Na+:H+ antiporter subunit A
LGEKGVAALGSSFEAGIGLAAVAPFVAAILAPYIQRFAGAYAGWILAIIPASIFFYLLGFADAVIHGETVSSVIEWIPAYGINLSFLVDGLSLIFALTISGVGTLIIL